MEEAMKIGLSYHFFENDKSECIVKCTKSICSDNFNGTRMTQIKQIYTDFLVRLTTGQTHQNILLFFILIALLDNHCSMQPSVFFLSCLF